METGAAAGLWARRRRSLSATRIFDHKFKVAQEEPLQLRCLLNYFFPYLDQNWRRRGQPTSRGYDLPRNFFADVRQDPEIWSSSHAKTANLRLIFTPLTPALATHLCLRFLTSLSRLDSHIQLLCAASPLNTSQLLFRAPQPRFLCAAGPPADNKYSPPAHNDQFKILPEAGPHSDG